MVKAEDLKKQLLAMYGQLDKSEEEVEKVLLEAVERVALLFQPKSLMKKRVLNMAMGGIYPIPFGEVPSDWKVVAPLGVEWRGRQLNRATFHTLVARWTLLGGPEEPMLWSWTMDDEGKILIFVDGPEGGYDVVYVPSYEQLSEVPEMDSMVAKEVYVEAARRLGLLVKDLDRVAVLEKEAGGEKA